jgi:hypothetical protein
MIIFTQLYRLTEELIKKEYDFFINKKTEDIEEYIDKKHKECKNALELQIKKSNNPLLLINNQCVDIFTAELSSLFLSYVENRHIQLQYSTWDCGLASLSNVSDNKIKLFDIYPNYRSMSEIKGISLKELQNILSNIEIQSKVIQDQMNLSEIQNINEKSILLISKDKTNKRKNSHYIVCDKDCIIDSEIGKCSKEEYINITDKKYILKGLILSSS